MRDGRRHDRVPHDRRRPARQLRRPGSRVAPALLGVTVARMNDVAVLLASDLVPQSVNFGLEGDVAASFLRVNGVEPKTSADAAPLPTPRTAAGGKALRSMPKAQALLVRAKIDQLAADPSSLANNVKRLQGRPGFRLRVGDYRVIFTEDNTVLDVLPIAHRREVHK